VESAAYDFNGAGIGQKVDQTFTLVTIDIAALRAARASPSADLLAQIQPDLHRGMYDLPLWPANIFADAAPSGFDALIEQESAARLRLEAGWGR